MPKKPDSEVTYGFGERIRALRKRAGLSQLELAHEIKVTKGAISWWEQGFTPDCSALALYRAAHVLDTTMEYLIAGKSFNRSDYPKNFMRLLLPSPLVMDQATARDEMPQTREELADELADEDVEETNNMTEVEIDEALLDAGRDPSAIVERAMKLIEVPHD